MDLAESEQLEQKEKKKKAGDKEEELTKADKQMLKNIKIAAEIVLIEDKRLLEELGKRWQPVKFVKVENQKLT